LWGCRLILLKKVTALYTKQVGLLNKPYESPLDHRINLLTKRVSDIRLRIYMIL
jgi:hypothetical protein